jgi:tRNA pseudouridine38-40 synthase
MSAKNKTYKYVILNRDSRPALDHSRVWFRRAYLDDKLLMDLLTPLVGTHDFATFCVRKSLKQNTVRTINFIDVARENDYIYIKFNANGFLHNMIRIIVGTAVFLAYNIGESKDMERILLAKDRLRAFATAPPYGLYLEEVFYE